METLSDLCQRHKLSPIALAGETGLDEKRIVAIFEGRWTPSPAERDKIAKVFGLTRDQIAWGHKTEVQHLYGHGPQFGRTP